MGFDMSRVAIVPRGTLPGGRKTIRFAVTAEFFSGVDISFVTGGVNPC
jgi:hypothetical protein